MYIYPLPEIPPTKDLHLVNADPTHMTVEWTPQVFNCSDVNYIVLRGANICGICTNTTANTYATCTNMTIDGRMCNLSIQTESKTCELLRGTKSDTLHIFLKGIIITCCIII